MTVPTATMRGMDDPPLQRKLNAEMRMRELLRDGDLPEPDVIEYAVTCIRLFFAASRTCVVIDL